MVETPHVIVPVAVLEGEVIPDALVEFLSAAPVVLLGYHRIPEQTTPDQARNEFEERAAQELAALADTFDSDGPKVESRLAFTHDISETIQRLVEEVPRSVVLRPNPVRQIDDVFVGVRDSKLVPTIAATLVTLVGPTEACLSLHYIESADDGDQLLTGMETTLQEAGISDRRIAVADDEEVSIDDAIERISESYDLVVLGEDDPGLMDFLWRPTAEEVAERSLAPVLVAQRAFDEA